MFALNLYDPPTKSTSCLINYNCSDQTHMLFCNAHLDLFFKLIAKKSVVKFANSTVPSTLTYLSSTGSPSLNRANPVAVFVHPFEYKNAKFCIDRNFVDHAMIQFFRMYNPTMSSDELSNLTYSVICMFADCFWKTLPKVKYVNGISAINSKMNESAIVNFLNQEFSNYRFSFLQQGTHSIIPGTELPTLLKYLLFHIQPSTTVFSDGSTIELDANVILGSGGLYLLDEGLAIHDVKARTTESSKLVIAATKTITTPKNGTYAYVFGNQVSTNFLSLFDLPTIC